MTTLRQHLLLLCRHVCLREMATCTTLDQDGDIYEYDSDEDEDSGVEDDAMLELLDQNGEAFNVAAGKLLSTISDQQGSGIWQR